MARVWYHLRVRELVKPNCWVKKSKFYEVTRPNDAVQKYLGRARKNGKREGVDFTVMWCEKDRRHSPDRFVRQTARLWKDISAEQRRKKGRFGDIGEFLRLGGELFQELKQTEKVKAVNRRQSSQEREKVQLFGGISE